MLRIELVNDGTGEYAHPKGEEPYQFIGNYNYKVFINDKEIALGRIEDCFRFHGWKGILSCLNKQVNGDRFNE